MEAGKILCWVDGYTKKEELVEAQTERWSLFKGLRKKTTEAPGDDATTLAHLLEETVKAMVDDADSVVVTCNKCDQSTVFEVKVATEEIGKVIGRQGRTAQALRTILNCAAAKYNIRCGLEIIE
jgi:predicted RNA-binding protein YlqC (UPF0109 family)